MRRLALLPALPALLLAACAPAASPRTLAVSPAPAVQAAFSDEGVVWSDGKVACAARAPQFLPVCPPWPAPTGSVAWNGGQPWAALPALGQVVTVDGPAQTVLAGRVAALSAMRIYREDGSALTYSGVPAGSVPGQPSAAVTGGDGQDYVWLAGQLLPTNHPGQGRPAGGPFLWATPAGAESGPFPSALTRRGRLELRGDQVFLGAERQPLPAPALALGTVQGRPYVLTRSGDSWRVIPVF